MENRGFAPPRGPRTENGGRAKFRVPKRARWYPLYEENEDFRLWFDNLARGSPTTAVERARVLYRFLGMMKMKLDELTAQIADDGDKMEKRLMAFVGGQEGKGYAPGSIENYLKSVRSWAKWHGVEFKRDIKIANRNATPTLDDEQVPTPRQVEDIRSAASSRGRICVGAVAYGGLRPEVLGHQSIDDGLKLADLPELNLKSLTFSKIPTLVVVRAELSKAGHPFRTFFPEETCHDVLSYLKRRRDAGEELIENSPLVAVASSQRGKGWRAINGSKSTHITQAQVSRDIRSSMRPTYKYRPYVLRSYFSTRLLMAVSDGVLDNNYRIFWMGHSGEMAARYSSNKALLPPDLIENMRQAYQRARPYLLGSALSEEDLQKKMVLNTARMWGAEEDQVAAIQEILDRAPSVEEAIKEISSSGIIIVRTSDSQREFAKELGVPKGSGDRFLVVNGDDALLEHVKNGWTLVREVEPEAPKGSVDDEHWISPTGEKITAKEKISVSIDQNSLMTMRGRPKELDEITAQLQGLGVHLEPQKPGPRYLLKKNPRV